MFGVSKRSRSPLFFSLLAGEQQEDRRDRFIAVIPPQHAKTARVGDPGHRRHRKNKSSPRIHADDRGLKSGRRIPFLIRVCPA
jgi:hypothetical protein